MFPSGQYGRGNGLPGAAGATSNCNVSKCPKPYGCTGPSGGKGGVSVCDGNGSATPNQPGKGKKK